MKRIFCFLLAICISLFSFGQKPPVDTATLNYWQKVEDPIISNNGEFFSYQVKDSKKGIIRVVIAAVKTKSLREFSIFNNYYYGPDRFDNNNHHAFIEITADTLAMVNLVNFTTKYLTHNGGYKFVRYRGQECLAYIDKGQFILYNLQTDVKKTTPEVSSFQISPNKHVIILQRQDEKGGASIRWLDLLDNKVYIICNNRNTSDFTLNNAGTEVVFLVDSANRKALWHYKPGMSKACLLTGVNASDSNKGFLLENITGFSDDDERLFLKFGKPVKTRIKTYDVPVNVWSYQDEKLQELNAPSPAIEGVYSILNGSLHTFSPLKVDDYNLYQTDEYEIINKRTGDLGAYWSRLSTDSIILISRTDGRQTHLPDANRYSFGIAGGYLVYFSNTDGNFYSRNLKTGKEINLTKGIHTVWSRKLADLSLSHYQQMPSVQPPVGWIKADSSILLYDRYDIWRIDVKGKRNPVCLTNGYGKCHHIILKFFKDPLDPSLAEMTVGARLTLTAFNEDTKENGFYQITVGIGKDPQPLSMGAYTYYAPQKVDDYTEVGMLPIKAKDAEAYIVSRQSASEAPNLFYTTDFKRFRQLTDIHPERAYNWLTTQLVNWTTSDGIKTQGVLYKPENFDPNKKYPVIFHIYELRSDKLNSFTYPEWCVGDINVPYFVSHGYLVFEPDIYYVKDKAFESALNTVVSAVKCLSGFPFVDSKRIGLQGHSWGAMQTNYIVTHTDLFAAVCSAAGMSDYIGYNGQSPLVSKTYSEIELTQARAPGNLWAYREWYINSSPIMNANKVVTPLIIAHGNLDPRCPFPQAVEFFTALRRLGKKAWMLEYEGEIHNFSHPKSQIDLTIRMKQFFDHYLLGAPAPKWMVEGVPASEKGYDSGLKLEPEGVEPGSGILKKQNQD